MRGALTETVQQLARELMGREISIRELRMMPYIQFLCINSQNVDPNKIAAEERHVLTLWRNEGYIEGGAVDLYVTKEFWNILHQILWEAYANK